MSRPFDEARYRALLEGLEVTELLLSVVRTDNDKLRIDSGYFAKSMLEAERRIRTYSGGFDELGMLFGRFVKGIFDINAESYADSGVPFLRILNLCGCVINDGNLALIPESIHQAEKKTELRKRDIVLSKTAYPAASLVTLERCNTSQDTIATTLSTYGRSTYFPEAIVAYLNSSLGERLLWRQFQGNVQLHLSLDDGRKVPIPRMGKTFQEKLAEAFEKASALRQQAIADTERAEQTLIRALGLENWQPPEPLTYIRSSWDAFAAGRLDAEHFQEKYYAARQALQKAGALEFLPIGDLLLSITNGHTPLYHNLTMGEVPFLCAEHISDFEINYESEKRILGIHHRTELARTALRNQDVLLTIKGRVGNAAIVEDVPSVVNINQDVALLRFNKKLPLWYIIAFLNSKFGKLQSEQMCTGAINPFLGLFSIRQFVIPLFGSNIMVEIAEQTRSKVLAAQKSKRRAAELLDAAKRAVEIAIESGEATALEFLNKTTEGGFSCT